jgi:predicted Rossmann fold flavoprotein
LYGDTKKQSVHRGKLLFTHVGLSGPTILNLSKTVGDMLQHSTVTIMVNVVPELDAGALKLALRALFVTASNKMVKNALADIVPSALVAPLLSLVAIDGDTPCHSVLTSDRTQLAKLMAALPIHISGLQGADKAIVSSGGVQPSEINFKSMESRLVPGLFVVGDMLDINRPSGGYSLQLCWTTGMVAGTHV